MAHEHGPHTCYCPSCGYKVTVDTGVQCNTLNCPDCGQPLRAVETGEYRSTRFSAYPQPDSRYLSAYPQPDPRYFIASKPQVSTANISCPVCGYPIPAPSSLGQQVKCAYCGSISQAITQDVSIPAWLLTLGIGLGIGVFAGPSLLASTEAGSQWLAKKARERIG